MMGHVVDCSTNLCPWGVILGGADWTVVVAARFAGGDSSLVKIRWLSTGGADMGPLGFSQKVAFVLRPE